MTLPRLHAVTDDARLVDARFVRDASEVLEAGGADVALHLRGRATSAARLYELALALKPVARAADARLLVNDRVDVTLMTRADGAQLREDSMSARDARRLLGENTLIGVSRHGAIDPASLDAADFVVWGSVFDTASHPDSRAAGLGGLREATGVVASALPVIGIGGITPERVGSVVAAGAYGVAALSGIWAGGGTAVADYRAALGSSLGTDPRTIG